MQATPIPGIYRRPRSQYFWMRASVNGKEIARSLKTSNQAEAILRRELILKKAFMDGLDYGNSDWHRRCRDASLDSQSWLCKFVSAANGRNKKRGSGDRVTIRDILKVARASGGRCSVSGIPFRWDGDVPTKGPYAASIDRIDSSLPYSRRNCRIVLYAVNLAMSRWGDAAFWDIARHSVGRYLMTGVAQVGIPKMEHVKCARK